MMPSLNARKTAWFLAAMACWPETAKAHFEGSGVGPLLHGATHAFSVGGALAVIAVALWFGSAGKRLARMGTATLVPAWAIGMLFKGSLSGAAALAAPLAAMVAGSLLALSPRLSERWTLLLVAAVGGVLGWSDGGAALGMAERIGAIAAIGVVALYTAVIAQAAVSRGAAPLLRIVGGATIIISGAVALLSWPPPS